VIGRRTSPGWREREDEDVVQVDEAEVESSRNVVHEALERLGGSRTLWAVPTIFSSTTCFVLFRPLWGGDHYTERNTESH
jgi:hypothetical protein